MTFGTLVVVLTGFYINCTGPLIDFFDMPPVKYKVRLTCKGKPAGDIWFYGRELKAPVCAKENK